MNRILFISSFFPNKNAPNIATYNRQQLLALSELCKVDALVPIPWTSKSCYKEPLAEDNLGAINIDYPVYYYLPLLARSYYGYMYYFSIRSQVKRLIADKKYDCVFSSWLYPDAWASSIIAKNIGVPLFLSVLGSDVNRLSPNSVFYKASLEVGRHAEKIFCVSMALKDKLELLGFDSSKLIYLQNGVDKEIFHPIDKELIRSNLNYGRDKKIILFVGNIKKEKGLVELIEAFRNLKKKFNDGKLLLLLVGSGKFTKKLKKMVLDKSISDQVEFLGEKSSSEIAELMNACDVLCLPSYSEGQPNVILEALTCETKVVATTVGGIPELDTGSNCMELVSPGDVEALTVALFSMLTAEGGKPEWPEFRSWHDNSAALYKLLRESFPNG